MNFLNNISDIIVAITTLVLCGITVYRAMKYGSSDVTLTYWICGIAVWQLIIAPLIFKR